MESSDIVVPQVLFLSVISELQVKPNQNDLKYGDLSSAIEVVGQLLATVTVWPYASG